jgi:uncharacterized protein (AIM24 family)
VADEVEGTDDEFLYHLNRGGELLTRGALDDARVDLEQALALRPNDAQVLGLLGQAFYRQGQFEQAAVAWQRLVDDNPVEAGARINLGLACLKARRFADAVSQLEIALDLTPGHKKAMGYLGLALLESADATRARGWFQKAGSEQMVARCDELLAAQAEAVAAAPPPAPEPVQALSPLLTSSASDEGAPPEAPELAPTLAAWAETRRLGSPGLVPFAVEGGALTVAVAGEVRCRLEGLVAWRGDLTFTGEVKRFRGRATDKPFGEGEGRMHRVAGQGLLVLRADGHRFTVVELGGEAGFFRDAVVFGFEEPLTFENGRLASPAGDVDLVHLRGSGRVALRSAGEPVALQVNPGSPARLPAAALVGWVGALTPKLVPAVDGGAVGASVELSGEGLVLLDAGSGAAP